MSDSPTERIEVRKIYIGKAALFGLLFGLIIGIIVGVFLFVRVLLGVDSISIFGRIVETNLLIGFFLLIGSVIFYSIAICAALAVCALLYNLIASIGGMLHIGLAEQETEQ